MSNYIPFKVADVIIYPLLNLHETEDRWHRRACQLYNGKGKPIAVCLILTDYILSTPHEFGLAELQLMGAQSFSWHGKIHIIILDDSFEKQLCFIR